MFPIDMPNIKHGLQAQNWDYEHVHFFCIHEADKAQMYVHDTSWSPSELGKRWDYHCSSKSTCLSLPVSTEFMGYRRDQGLFVALIGPVVAQDHA